jgi:hypothetical protein
MCGTRLFSHGPPPNNEREHIRLCDAANVWDILLFSWEQRSPSRWGTVSAGSPVRLGKRTRRREATLLSASEVKAERRYEKSKRGETVGAVNDSETQKDRKKQADEEERRSQKRTAIACDSPRTAS